MAKRSQSVANEPRKRPHQERARATVDAILTATAKALKAEGYESMTTNRIAASAGVSVGTLYEYFPSKESIVALLVDQHFATIENIVSAAIREFAGKSLKLSVEGIVQALFDVQKRDPELCYLLRDLAPLVGKLAATNEMHRRFAFLVAMDLATRNDLRITDLDLTALVVVKLADTMTHVFNSRIKSIPPERAAKELVDLLHLYLTGQPAAPH